MTTRAVSEKQILRRLPQALQANIVLMALQWLVKKNK